MIVQDGAWNGVVVLELLHSSQIRERKHLETPQAVKETCDFDCLLRHCGIGRSENGVDGSLMVHLFM